MSTEEKVDVEDVAQPFAEEQIHELLQSPTQKKRERRFNLFSILRLFIVLLLTLPIIALGINFVRDILFYINGVYALYRVAIHGAVFLTSVLLPILAIVGMFKRSIAVLIVYAVASFLFAIVIVVSTVGVDAIMNNLNATQVLHLAFDVTASALFMLSSLLAIILIILIKKTQRAGGKDVSISLAKQDGMLSSDSVQLEPVLLHPKLIQRQEAEQELMASASGNVRKLSVKDLQDRYRVELVLLSDLGYKDTEKNLTLLQRYNGRVQSVVQELITNGQDDEM